MKKNEKRICWNCDGDVSHHFTDCPYCGVDLTHIPPNHPSHPRELGDPFQSAPQSIMTNKDSLIISEQDWKQALNATAPESEPPMQAKRELVALLLLLPGIVFCLFALLLIFFSDHGVLALQWNQNLAYFYFLGAVPLIFLGWRTMRGR